jgi:hypothetical protein
MYRGRYQNGDTVPLRVLCRDAAGVPGVPPRAPQVTVWSPAGAKVRVRVMPVLDRYGQAGLFHYPLYLDGDFAPGLYRAVYNYNLGSYVGIEEDGFEVLAGGNADGAVVALHFYVRPHARFVMQSLDSGKMVQGRNPTV